MPKNYKSNKELAKDASIKCSLIELEFRHLFLKQLNENFLKRIIDREKMNDRKNKLIDRLHSLKIVHLIFSLIISKRVMIAI